MAGHRMPGRNAEHVSRPRGQGAHRIVRHREGEHRGAALRLALAGTLAPLPLSRGESGCSRVAVWQGSMSRPRHGVTPFDA